MSLWARARAVAHRSLARAAARCFARAAAACVRAHRARADRCWRWPIRRSRARTASRCPRSPSWWSTRARARISATAQKQTEAARAALTERLGRIPGLDVRFVEAGEADGETDGTRLFSALGAALADVPPDRVAGAILITDGRVHDVPGGGRGARLQRAGARADHRRARRARPPRRCWSRRRASASSASRRPWCYRVEDQGAPRRARRRSPSAATARC